MKTRSLRLFRYLFPRAGRAGGLALLMAGGLAVTAVAAQTEAAAIPAKAPKDDFSPLVKLAPFVVNGETLAVSIHARTSRDRRYAEDFAETVLKLVY